MSVKVAVIGCGRIAGHHCRSIQEISGVELTAVCDLVLEKAEVYAKEFGVPSYSDYREMLDHHPEIAIVAVVTPSGMHYEHTMEILRDYGKHVVVEKPTFMKPSQVKEAYAAAATAGVQIFPVFQNRHNLAVRRLKQGIEAGELGQPRIVSVRVRWCRPQRYYDLAPWRGTYAQDGGALTNQGIHHVDLLRFLGGEVRRVNSVMRTYGAAIEVEDTVISSIEFKNGAVGVLEVTTAARPVDYEASISFVCENGLAQLGGIAVNELQVYSPSPSECRAHSEDFSGCVYGNGHRLLYKEIVEFFESGKAFSVTPSDCLLTIELLNAFYQSDERKEWVVVGEGDESLRLGRSDEALANLYRTARRSW